MVMLMLGPTSRTFPCPSTFSPPSISRCDRLGIAASTSVGKVSFAAGCMRDGWKFTFEETWQPIVLAHREGKIRDFCVTSRRLDKKLLRTGLPAPPLPIAVPCLQRVCEGVQVRAKGDHVLGKRTENKGFDRGET